MELFWKDYFREQKKRKSQYTKMSIKIYQQLIELDETRQREWGDIAWSEISISYDVLFLIFFFILYLLYYVVIQNKCYRLKIFKLKKYF